MDILDILVIGFFVYLATRAVSYLLTASIKEKEKDLEEFKSRLSKITHAVSVEKHGDQLYWFDADTDLFLGQGVDESEIIKVVQKRFPTHIFILPDDSVVAGPSDWAPKHYSDVAQIKKLVQKDTKQKV